MKILCIHTHPIQYQVPLYRLLNQEPDVDLVAAFFSDHSLQGGQDRGFGQAVKWDVPLTEGYEARFLPNEGQGNEGSGFHAYRFSGFRTFFQQEMPDVIILPGHGYRIYWQAAAAARRLGIPVLVRPECVDGSQRKRAWWKAFLREQLLRHGFYRNVSVFCSTGVFSKREGQHFGFVGDRLGESLYCVDTDLIERGRKEFMENRQSIREEIGMQEDDLGIVFMGKMIEWKNPVLILKAIREMGEDGSKLFPILVGSGPEYEQLVQSCEEVCGNGRFCCPGFVNQRELGRYYTAGDAFVLPSKRGFESWGLVVNEAMGYSLPVAVSDGVGCRKDLVENKETGYIFPDGDAEQLSDVFSKWLSDPSLREKQSENAAELIQNYSSRHAAQGLLTASRIAGDAAQSPRILTR